MLSGADIAFLSTVATAIPILVVGSLFAGRRGLYARLAVRAVDPNGERRPYWAILLVAIVCAVVAAEGMALTYLASDLAPPRGVVAVLLFVTLLLFTGFVVQLVYSAHEEVLEVAIERILERRAEQLSTLDDAGQLSPVPASPETTDGGAASDAPSETGPTSKEQPKRHS